MATENLLSHMPDEILIEIFLSLPARSLLRFRSVSKHWLDLIQSPDFITLHLNTSKLKPSLFLVVPIPQVYSNTYLRDSVITSISGDDETLVNKDIVAFESLSHWINSMVYWFHRACLHGPCNGLFCITDTSDIMIFNPGTKQRREVIRLPLMVGQKSYYDRVCFGFDSVSHDYKVVGFVEISQRQFNDGRDVFYSDIGRLDTPYRNFCRVEIYSLSTKTWSQVNRMSPIRKIPWCCKPTHDLFFNGAFHWLERCSNNIFSVVGFDLNNRAFKTFKLPYSFHDGYYPPVNLSVLNEQFTIIVHEVLGLGDEIEIWVMNEYGVYDSWTKLFSINVGKDIIRAPLSSSKDGELLFKDCNGRLLSLNLKTRKMKKLEVVVPDGKPMFAFWYRETLVSLDTK